MRILSDGLLAAQRAMSGTPAVSLAVGATDYSSRLKQYLYQERPYGGLATIVLDNHDKAITADLRGSKVVIGNGFSGQGYSNAPSLWVLTQTDSSREGELVTQLLCIDIWQKLSLLRIIGGGGVELKGTVVGTFQRSGETVTGQTSGAKAVVLGSGTGFIWVVRVAKGPFTVGEVVKSDIYTSTQITVSSVTDIGGGSSPAWAGNKTILAIIQQLCTGVVTVVLDSSDGIVDVFKPTYATDANTPYLEIIQDLMNMTKCGIRASSIDDKLHIFNISSAPGSPDYSYDSVHKFVTELRDVTAILPNKIIVINAEQVGTGVTPYYGEAKDDIAIAQFGMEIPQIIFADVQSDADATLIAAARLNRIQKEAVRGTVEVPVMNCGQELFDYVRITDASAGLDFYGWIGSIERRYDWDNGVYSLTIGLGGLVGAVGLPAEADYPLPNIEQPPIPPSKFVPTPWVIPAAIQGFQHDITFTATAYNAVGWTSGTIKFYDGTTQAIASGSYTIPDTSVRYIYFNLDSAPTVLKITDNYLNVMTLKTGVVCMIQRGSDSGVKATVIPSFGKTPLITADIIYLTGLLDRLPDGTYAKALATQLSAGLIRLTAQAIKDGDWYDESGVDINATTGITIYGKAGAFRTRATKTGADQCYMGVDGKIYAGAGNVVLSASGIKLIGEGIVALYSGATEIGILGASAAGLVITPSVGKNILIGYSGRDFNVAGILKSVSGTGGGIILPVSAIAQEGSIKILPGEAGIYVYRDTAWQHIT